MTFFDIKYYNVLLLKIDPKFLSNFVQLSIQVLKFVGSETDRDEARIFDKTTQEILISSNYQNKYMSIHLLNSVNIMIDEKLNPSRIFRTMAKN